MPQSRKRTGHPFQKRSAISAKQRTSAKTICALLLAIFTGMISLFSGAGYLIVIISIIGGGVLGYYIGKVMEQQAKNKV